ncbi:MAG: PadR family transcriptional regulator [Chloroflexi bacterium]|nr:PadR family transcriptional regulator [Chloroflexota bacterium]
MTTPNRTPSDFLPLPASQLHILLALTTGDNHGYGIMKEVEAFTAGAVTMGPGTLYGAIKQMLKAGLIEETFERPDPDLDDERRRYYCLTELGDRTLDAEVLRLEQLARAARTRRTDVMRSRGTQNAL